MDVEGAEQTEEIVETTETEEQPEPTETKPEAEETEDEDAIEDEVQVTIGEAKPVEEPKQAAPAWVRELRRKERELQREVRELRAKLQTTPTENKPAAPGPKPKLEDHDYDAEQYETALANWFERKRAADEHARKAKEAEEGERQAWQSRLDAYGKAKASLRVRDYEDAEAVVVDTLNVTQQGIIVSGAENPAVITYALGKDPAKLKELAAITDPVKFSFAVAKLETQLKVTPKAKPPTPEQSPKGSAPKTNAIDSTLERLRDEAQRTGNADRLLAYKRQLKSASK
jgi:hypothetical protein